MHLRNITAPVILLFTFVQSVLLWGVSHEKKKSYCTLWANYCMCPVKTVSLQMHVMCSASVLIAKQLLGDPALWYFFFIQSDGVTTNVMPSP